jgi:hypothetical protein
MHIGQLTMARAEFWQTSAVKVQIILRHGRITKMAKALLAAAYEAVDALAPVITYHVMWQLSCHVA